MWEEPPWALIFHEFVTTTLPTTHTWMPVGVGVPPPTRSEEQRGPFWTSSWGSGQNPPVQRAELGSLFRHGVGKRRMGQRGSRDLGSIPGNEGLPRSGKEVPGSPRGRREGRLAGHCPNTLNRGLASTGFGSIPVRPHQEGWSGHFGDPRGLHLRPAVPSGCSGSLISWVFRAILGSDGWDSFGVYLWSYLSFV